jgi:phenylacetate-coenzyme A ligase PaaK-like adenylate-forming protein
MPIGSPRTWQVWGERLAGAAAIAAGQRDRLDALVGHARAASPLYSAAYAHLPDGPVDLHRLPVMSKRVLMDGFDDWSTDRAIVRTEVDRFLANRLHVGDAFLGRYVVWKSSGTSGAPGIYVQDEQALDVYDALITVQLGRPDLFARCTTGLLLRGGRSALVAATGDHYASVASWQRAARSEAARRVFSVLEPIDRLVVELNAFLPAFLASYPTTLALLADERRAGRLRITPDLVWAGGESLSPATHRALEDTFGCPVVNEYGASECMSIAFGCRSGWLHVNEDWVVAEPVDADLRPTAPGKVSHTLLITNLANRVQPLIRYDLGDAVELHPGRCECGNALQAIRVTGRQDDMVALRGAAGLQHISPMALTTLVEEASCQHRFQIVHRAPGRLDLRFGDDLPTADRAAAFGRAASALQAFLRSEGVDPVRIVLDDGPPRCDGRSGKLRQVIDETGERAMPGERAGRRGRLHAAPPDAAAGGHAVAGPGAGRMSTTKRTS